MDLQSIGMWVLAVAGVAFVALVVSAISPWIPPQPIAVVLEYIEVVLKYTVAIGLLIGIPVTVVGARSG